MQCLFLLYSAKEMNLKTTTNTLITFPSVANFTLRSRFSAPFLRWSRFFRISFRGSCFSFRRAVARTHQNIRIQRYDDRKLNSPTTRSVPVEVHAAISGSRQHHREALLPRRCCFALAHEEGERKSRKTSQQPIPKRSRTEGRPDKDNWLPGAEARKGN